MKKLLCLVLAILLVTSLAISAGASAELVELTMWQQWSGNTAQMFNEMVDEYNQTEGAAAGVKVVVQQVEDENSEMMMQLMAARLSDTMPDMIHVAQQNYNAMAINGLFAEPPKDVQDYIVENYFDANADLAEYNGVHWGYPTENQCMALIYNKQLFSEAGIKEPPKTWEELRADAKLLTKRDASGELTQCGFIFPFTFSEAMHTQHISMFWGAGDELYPTLTSTNVADENGVKLLELFKGMADDGSTNANWLAWDECYNNGKGAMMMMDPWFLKFNVYDKGIEGLYENTGVAFLPTLNGEPGASMARGFEMTVSSGSKHQEEAWAFLKWLNQKDDKGVSRMQSFMTEKIAFLPSMKGYDMPSMWLPEWRDMYAQILAVAKNQPKLADYDAVQNSIDNMKDNVMLNGMDPTEAAKAAEAEINAIFAEKG